MMGEGGRRLDEGGAKIARARSLRKRSTDAERRLWELLRDRRLVQFKFRRQVLAAVARDTRQAAPPSSALRAPSPIKGEGEGADGAAQGVGDARG